LEGWTSIIARKQKNTPNFFSVFYLEIKGYFNLSTVCPLFTQAEGLTQNNLLDFLPMINTQTKA
jgi:hypothetical protein